MKPVAEPVRCSGRSRAFCHSLTASGGLEMLTNSSEQLLHASGVFYHLKKKMLQLLQTYSSALGVTGTNDCSKLLRPGCASWR